MARVERGDKTHTQECTDYSNPTCGHFPNCFNPHRGCDVPTLLYSFSFNQNPDWSKELCEGPEILECELDYPGSKHRKNSH